MIGGSATSHGLTRMIRRQDKRVVMMVDLQWIGRLLKKYIFEVRLPAMWDNRGKVPGKYGAGSETWAENKPSTVKAKGFNKPMHSSRARRGSSMARNNFAAYFFGWRTRRASKKARNATIEFAMGNEVTHSVHLEDGRKDMAARKHAGFIEGDTIWLGDETVKDIAQAGDA